MSDSTVKGQFVDLNGERFYKISNVDKMPTFFISIVSGSDHWLFAASNGGLTAGRTSPETALFPYTPVDKIYDNAANTGSKTIIWVKINDSSHRWEPFNKAQDDKYTIQRHLYKNTLGNKLCYEEINESLKFTFRYIWMSSDTYGFVRQCWLENLSDQDISADIIDGLQNILPAGVPRELQNTSSNLIDAYKWTGLESNNSLAYYTLYSGITDKPEPFESLRANTVFCLGFETPKILLSTQQLNDFHPGQGPEQASYTRGIRGDYLISSRVQLAPASGQSWLLVADVEQTQAQVVNINQQLQNPEAMKQAVIASVDAGSDELERIMAATDGFQVTAEETVSLHHYANVLFNNMRGGVFDEQYQIDTRDFIESIKYFNQKAWQTHQTLLSQLPGQMNSRDLMTLIKGRGDQVLERLGYEYLPLTFGRRHGDPSRPWNQFAIRLKDKAGNRLLSYQGNWRDIFQNWEALLFSYPEFIESVIAKFVNASTIDGYNPYRITKEGIDWEVEEPDDPWSYIGYWGDHQIIYLLKLLELSDKFHPEQLRHLLLHPVFCYANVPYRIKPFAALLQNPKDTITYDTELAEKIEQRVEHLGADGKLLLNSDNTVYQVNLLEKLLIPLLSKLSNLVPGGGIWMNTQRPEWNDANNALVGQGLSMVTLYYLRRYICFMQGLLDGMEEDVFLSNETSTWLEETASVLKQYSVTFSNQQIGGQQALEVLRQLGTTASEYRETVYQQEGFSGQKTQSMTVIHSILANALTAVEHSINAGQRQDGLYHAYNLLSSGEDSLSITYLQPMLEGQVAALSSGAISPAKAVVMLDALFASDLYRTDQQTFMLYPDKEVQGFLERNVIPVERISEIPLLNQMLKAGDGRIIVKDAAGTYRFNADIVNIAALDDLVGTVLTDYVEDIDSERVHLCTLYEEVFKHQQFTGRSGGMFGFEGLGSIYWHMVSKLLLATQEIFFTALAEKAERSLCQQLGHHYYRIRKGIGFNKSPAEYGAFPTDPYSHTPGHAGAQQPGMTGQVKEEILTRFGELGISVSEGMVTFNPQLLRICEFLSEPKQFRYLDITNKWQELMIPAHGLAFTWCQVPIIYILDDKTSLTAQYKNGTELEQNRNQLSAKLSQELFRRTGEIKCLTLTLDRAAFSIFS